MRGRRPSLRKAPPSRSLPEEAIGWGDAGGEAASLREAPLPQTPSPEEWLGIGLSVLLELCAHARWVRLPAYWLRSTAADRAAARTCGVGDEPLRPPTAGTSPFRGGFAWRCAPKAPSAEACEERRRSRHRSLFRARWERSKGFAIALWKPSPDHLFQLYGIQRWQVAAALSAAVTTTQQQEPAPTSQAEPSQKKRPNPNASRSSGERGLGGEALLSEKRPLPPESPQPTSLEEEREGGDFSSEKAPPSHTSLHPRFL